MKKFNLIEKFRKIVDPKRVLNEFYDYVSKANLDFNQYKFLLSEEFFNAIQEENLIWNGQNKLIKEKVLNKKTTIFCYLILIMGIL